MARRKTARGTALLELMVSAVILLVVTVGFVAAVKEAMSATAVAHRRTELTLLRTGLLEKLAVVSKVAVDELAGQGWLIESCYDKDAIPTGDNAAWSVDYTCPDGTTYRRLLSVTAVPAISGVDQQTWSVQLLVDRADSPCDANTRFSSLSCVGANVYITD